MTTGILIVSHKRDLEFLVWCLRSIRKFVTGVEKVVVVLPDHEYSKMWKALDEFRFPIISTKLFDQSKTKPFLHHEYISMNAEQWCDGVDLIMHVDSDCF